MTTKFVGLVVAAFTSVVAVTAPVAAQEAKIVPVGFVEDEGAQERINFSGKLRMLSQRIPSAACHLVSGVDPEGSTKLLQSATAEFEAILDALEFGNPEMNVIGAEKRRKTLVKIHDLREKWAPMRAAADAIVAGSETDENLRVVLEQNMNVLGSAKLLVSELSGQYSNPVAMVQADALVIDIAGRQRMLTQKMAKESCIMASPHATDETASELQGTMQMFERSLFALVGGMPEVGIRRPPNESISAGLEIVVEDWKSVKPVLDAILAGADVDTETKARKFQVLNTTMADMNKVVGMYTKATKHEL